MYQSEEVAGLSENTYKLPNNSTHYLTMNDEMLLGAWWCQRNVSVAKRDNKKKKRIQERCQILVNWRVVMKSFHKICKTPVY